ncbi:large subunit ribosomal protein L7e [Nematocida displodere]|uniref:Large subunit ribosomal protein L7e n=1 Tax=Nematocida displodere TaxID=1805483 RepID=A0A177EJ80_9MICR|nr:large subunit ribosomal protein L7e [Nematocida displodere]
MNTAVKKLSSEELKSITVNSIRKMKAFAAEEERKIQEAEAKNEIYVPAESAMFFAVRIRSSNRAAPAIVSALETLRLKKLNTGIFVVNNKSTKALLHQVRSYVAYGSLSLEQTREMLYKKGLCRVNGTRANITQEVLYEQFGGEISTVEEIVEAFYFGKPNASAINKFLWPFRLSCPIKGFGGRKIRDFTEGGATGDHGSHIGNLVLRMI